MDLFIVFILNFLRWAKGVMDGSPFLCFNLLQKPYEEG